MILKKRIKMWWDGEYVPYENDPNSGIFMIGGHTNYYHFTQKTKKTEMATMKTNFTAIGLL